MTEGRAKLRVKGQKDTVRKKWITCDYFGKSRIRITVNDRRRPNRGTIKTGCLMQCVVTQQEDDRDMWVFEIV